MKKRTLALLLCMATAATLTACGDKDGAVSETEATEAVEATETASEYTGKRSGEFDLDYDKYVTLADYSNIEVSISGDYDVDDTDVEDYITQMFDYYGPYYEADDSKTVIEDGDIVNVDYVGKLDGEAFDGGTAENQNIDVTNNCAAGGSTSYIDGFTDGLVGASVGDEIDCDVTFPDDYQNTDLAGKAVVFTFTINSIQKEITQDQMTDDFVSENFGVDSVEKMNEQVKSYLESTAESNESSDTYTAIQDWLKENCTVEVPDDYLEARVAEYQYNFEQQNCSDGTSLEDYLSTTYGYTLDQAKELWTEYMKENIELEFILTVISEKEGIELDEDEYQTYISNPVSNSSSTYGTSFEDEDELYSFYGMGHADEGEAYLRRIYVANLALDKLKENATVTVTEAVEDTETAESTETVEETEVTE